MSQQPSLGRIVIAVGGKARSNGADACPAVITRVWGEHPDGGWTINATLLPDAGQPTSATSIRLYDDEAEARHARGPLGDQHGTTTAFWPPRV